MQVVQEAPDSNENVKSMFADISLSSAINDIRN